MVVQVTETELNLRAQLTRMREAMRNVPAKTSRVTFKNLIKNGGFDNGLVGWTNTNSHWSVVGGRAYHSSTGNYYPLSVLVTLERPALLQFDAEALTASGTSQLLLNTVTEQLIALGSASYSVPLSNGVKNIGFSREPGSTAEFYIDNVSLWEADPTDNAPWLRLPFGHTVGTQGHINRDNAPMMASDYEEITILGQTYIKPMVAPGANTEFDVYCGIGA